MKKIILLVLILSSGFVAGAQSVSETVGFMNDAILESTKSVLQLQMYDELKVNDKGKLTSDVFMNLGEFTLMESSSAYLKNLIYSETKFFSEENGTNHYVIILKTADNTNAVSRQVKSRDNVSKVDQIAITIYTREHSKKVKDAIIHLLSIAKTNSQFLAKDLF